MLDLAIQQNAPIALDVNLQCQSNEMVALVGPSGAGKTTVLRSIAGLYQPQTGYIHCQQQQWFNSEQGVDLSPQQRRVGMLFQHYALFPHLTLLQNLTLAMQGEKNANAQAMSLLEMVNLTGLEQRYPKELSGGQKQRAALARALARKPDVLLLDEPFSAVDKVTRRKLYHEVNLLRKNLAMPIILVTHDLDEAAMLADSLCVIHHGKTLQQDSPEKVLLKPNSVEVARQVDMVNLFEGKIVSQNGQLQLACFDTFFEITAEQGFHAEQSVYWSISPAKVILHQRVRTSKGEKENPISASIIDLMTLRGISTVVLQLGDASQTQLHMHLAEHVALRNQLKVGERVSVTLLAEAIHIMAA
jgi:molybdate transport system ATP-binding protein